MKLLPQRAQKTNSGQALLIVLLSMAVVLTVVLSAASRSVSDIQVTTYEEDAYRAFSAAEAGIEESLLTGSQASGIYTDPSGGQVSYDSDILQTSAGSTFDYPVNLNSGEVATFWFISHDPNNLNVFLGCNPDVQCTRTPRMKIYWGDCDATAEPAIILSIFHDEFKKVTASNDYSTVGVITLTYDPDASRRGSNNFGDHLHNLSCPGKYAFETDWVNLTSVLPVGCALGTINNGGCLLMAKVKMLYNSTSQAVGIEIQGGGGGNGRLPSQGLLISSTGETGEVTRKVNVLQGYPVPQSPFENVLYSGSDLAK